MQLYQLFLAVAVLGLMMPSGTNSQGKGGNCKCGKLNKCIYDGLDRAWDMNMAAKLATAKQACIAEKPTEKGVRTKIYDCCKINFNSTKAGGKDIQYCVLEKACDCSDDLEFGKSGDGFITKDAPKKFQMEKDEGNAIGRVIKSLGCIMGKMKGPKKNRPKRGIDKAGLDMFKKIAFQQCPSALKCKFKKTPKMDELEKNGYPCMKKFLKCILISAGFKPERAEGLILFCENNMGLCKTAAKGQKERQKRSAVFEASFDVFSMLGEMLPV